MPNLDVYLHEARSDIMIITIPDLHGKDVWKRIEVDKYSKIIFLGDYVDSQTHTNSEVVENLQNILKLKVYNKEKVVLLLGNHDMQYMFYPHFQCSGMDYEVQKQLTNLLKENAVLFKYAYQDGDRLWTHAGISNGWLAVHQEQLMKWVKNNLNKELADALNAQGQNDPRILAEVSYLRGGHLQHGGILWADKQETCKDYLSGLHQFVGHSKVQSIKKYGDENSSITYLDCLNTVEDYLVLK